MGIITMGIGLDNSTHKRIKIAAQSINQTPNWLIKQAIFSYLIQIEGGKTLPEISLYHFSLNNSERITSDRIYQPFLELLNEIVPQSTTRSIVTKNWCTSEMELIPVLLEQCIIDDTLNKKIHALALRLSSKLRQESINTNKTSGIVQNLLKNFPLSSEEGISLMCLAEALLRIPDNQMRDILIYDKIKSGQWDLHLNNNNTLIVNLMTRGLIFIKKLMLVNDNQHVSNSFYKKLRSKIFTHSSPLIRKAVNITIRLLGKQFVIGENIDKALSNSLKLEKSGFSFSYDMLGEAALTDSDAKKYLRSYTEAIHAIGKASKDFGIYEGPGISIKLSALHPRYTRTQYSRIIEELYSNLKSLALLAHSYNIGINIDAEESERLELSLDLLEKLCFEPALKNWNGIGFVIQSYMKRCIFVIDELIDLAQRSNHRIMIRLVKGAYWDTEIKRAQIDGLENYPVYTRKVYTDVSYIACARKLLSFPNLIYPQFATHNAHTLSTIYQLAGNDYYIGQYEFQCLYGMGETLYKEIVAKKIEGNNKFNRPCRIYAPVGTHEKLLAYLVRRLLENGANTSFVNKIIDQSIPINELIENPVKTIKNIGLIEGTIGKSHPKIPLPRCLYGDKRINSKGININNEQSLTTIANDLIKNTEIFYLAKPIIKNKLINIKTSRLAVNPAISNDILGRVLETDVKQINQAIEDSLSTGSIWSKVLPKQRAVILERAAKIMENRMSELICILIREAGKTCINAISEVRESIDFIYYYSNIIKKNFNNDTHVPLGSVVCISPWNFPLAIFIGQIVAALATGNTVIAKPAEQTPIIAVKAVEILLMAGIPVGALQLFTGSGETVGKTLINDSRIQGVLFTGSTKVAKIIQKNIAGRLDKKGNPIPLIAETGGINAMIVDSSALTEQVVIDVITSAFDSAGQRCSSLRLLCIQEEVADRTIKMLLGAIAEYKVGSPDSLSTDIGPIIDAHATKKINNHINFMYSKGFKIHQSSLENKYNEHSKLLSDNFVKPTLIEINDIIDLQEEIFGPVLHIVRFKRDNLLNIIKQINMLNYGLTLGLHTRVNTTIHQLISEAKVGNVYINRNMIGAVVGVQPFGGEALSGTGPKAGGPLYLYRLLSSYPNHSINATIYQQGLSFIEINDRLRKELLLPYYAFSKWAKNKTLIGSLCLHYYNCSKSGFMIDLPSSTGERNTVSLYPREKIFCVAYNEQDILIQLTALISIGGKALWQDDQLHRNIFNDLPEEVKNRISLMTNPFTSDFDAVIFHGSKDRLSYLCKQIADQVDKIVPIQGFASTETNIFLERLLVERSVSINTTAAGGNTNLITIN
ncbi:trifunctional transcriptional regulator/proline dehydrogenase/L-glutamate gamma-semialdehyde dehydrogenase [Candidatus Pantoea edessiphila]|uniref:Bifunctional protein PutA n=1 Tax=Candidatus Pantoea edessiphila TaxID=2044610 RepID=A0A2P5SWM6_9GAMM|nr:trifunctional transcriptional regulator/proline dehydrogenase/L-glutamate gamma-semialdehyde dehydrogenase [Candidatus Pantoea edessiphila]PPI86748.1 trifunctional transcriptional regulator/proline dehydrogenase/L-glutamate gamma-semialdehyde dehydrogenase [Candidatus Pantoea edessiphila]